ncbi:MAG: hypothetical protein RLZZ338_4768 [Cyanobacteriota bacterium]|jgi:stage II sporulation protein D
MMKSQFSLTYLFSGLTKGYWWGALFLWLLIVAPAQASLILRVAIQEGVNQVKVGSTTRAIVRDGSSGQILGEIPGMDGFAAQPSGNKVALSKWQANDIIIEPSANGYVWIGDRWYRGSAMLISRKGSVTAVNYVDLEQYLYSVLGAEMSGNWPQEALKAQAVAARSYALHKRQGGGNGIYDLDDTQGSQVYKGLETESSGTYAAVDATKDQVLTYNGQVILAAFHSSSGGHTENVEEVWSQPLPYLRGVPDFDQGSPVFEWSKTFTRAQLNGLISGVGNIMELTPQRKTTFGSIVSMKVVGDQGSKVLSGDALREVLGLKSNRFMVVPVNNSKNPTAFEVKGRGFGHAIGLSQYGAYNLAQQGYKYDQILAYYYRGANLAKIQVQ